MSVESFAWKVVGIASGLMAARMSRRVLDRAWERTVGGEPPRNPASPSTTWSEAVSWAVASGVAVGLARLVAARGAASTWRKATGHLPPGLEEVGA